MIRASGDLRAIAVIRRRRRSSLGRVMSSEFSSTMLDTLAERQLIEKKRYKVEFDSLIWEIDELFGENAGFILAELELQREDQAFRKPDWMGGEVTGDPCCCNANLVKHPLLASSVVYCSGVCLIGLNCQQ